LPFDRPATFSPIGRPLSCLGQEFDSSWLTRWLID
jgi:hypothetical protein